ncbi:MAG TPA: sigma factor-like helix-turn-helix DNA-binding protein, partial [Pseudomonadota bacterium]|nr:sigma factor-like helix-turn-helix DNA-binding protein [Pseudomonadota bacterium]
ESLAGPGAASGTFPGAAIPAGAPAGAGGGLAFPGEQAQLQRTAHALALLPTETRVTLMLVAMQGRPIAEVAELLGCSELTCRFWLRHGMKLMRRALQRDLVEDEFVSRESRLLLSPGALNDLRRSKKAAARA